MSPEDDATRQLRVLDHTERLATMNARIDYLEAAREEQIKMHHEAMERLRRLEVKVALWAGGAAGAGGLLGQVLHIAFGG